MKRCNNAKRYDGWKRPRCCGGKGCDCCWDLYRKMEAARRGIKQDHLKTWWTYIREVVSPQFSPCDQDLAGEWSYNRKDNSARRGMGARQKVMILGTVMIERITGRPKQKGEALVFLNGDVLDFRRENLKIGKTGDNGRRHRLTKDQKEAKRIHEQLFGRHSSENIGNSKNQAMG